MPESDVTQNISDELNAATALPFAMQVADNPHVKGVKYGAAAMIAAGAQSEFIANNMLQAQALKTVVILRAGDPPQYNKQRSPKSGVNLTKTSKQGFFKGALSTELRFSRLDAHQEPLPHHAKDAAHLALSPCDTDYQHSLQLDINMRDILRELSNEGDLHVLGFDEISGLLRLAYKEGHGPKTELFNGQFTVNLYQSRESPQFYSREWDRPEFDPNWDADRKIITKPAELAALPDELYERFFNHTFKLGYTEEKISNPEAHMIKKAEVFANRPRSAEEFKYAMGESHEYLSLINHCVTLPQIISTLNSQLGQEKAEQLIIETYNKSGLIVAGDWDGMALGHPPGLDPQFTEVINTFQPGLAGLENQERLIDLSEMYLEQIKTSALEKQQKGELISAFESKALSIPSLTEIASEFAIARVGCTTVHEFVFQQILNDAYRDNLNVHYGQQYNISAVQAAMDKLLPMKEQVSQPIFKQLVANVLKSELMAEGKVSDAMLVKLTEFLLKHLSLASELPNSTYVLPHLHHDVNVQDLYQHGFDMRNPYGSNLDGAWLLLSDDGGLLYGDTQEQLIQVLLTGDMLKNNHLDIMYGLRRFCKR